MPSNSQPSWWRPRRHGERRHFLLARAATTRAVRHWFDAEGFVEVETATLQVSPGAEAHLHGFATQAIATDGAREQVYLRTSPEFACKKLLAAGEIRIFEMGRVWRNRERGPLHHPEFTLLEWYRAHAPYEALIDDCAALLALAAETTGARALTWRGRTADPFATPERLSVADAFSRFAGVDLLATVDDGGDTDRDALAAAAKISGMRVAGDDTWSDIFSRILVEKIEPHLGHDQPTILCDYPVPEAALARPSTRDPRVAERFELYACGVELANAFGELTDPVEQRRRFELEMAEMQRVYGQSYPIDEDLLLALADMPAASGCALGFDRLVMLATGAAHIEQVLWSPAPGPL